MQLRVGLTGNGQVSDIYLRNAALFDELDILASGSLDRVESAAKAAASGVPLVADSAEILRIPDIRAILNLTIPAARADVSLGGLGHGKHVYSEKPFIADLEDGLHTMSLAAQKGLPVGNVPDIFSAGVGRHCAVLSIKVCSASRPA
ncbi:MAG: hypothetical protein CME02_11715 [Geminicoccus sp.]|nr:hypothetical protein [Geminicoccus sp.]